MKAYRIFYTIPGVTHKQAPSKIVKADNPEAAVEAFRSANTWTDIVAIFKA